ncbi:hypothetical protein AGMMS50239_04090 [Bacteroidia bacterium]|nr:hypothetical protein AGMMS50239_04090 [Bacteroidia bacterium]
MSQEIKISTIPQAENYINRQNREIQSLRTQLSHTEANARLAAQQEATIRINAERQAMNNRLNQEINNLQNKMQSEINAEKQARIMLDLEQKRWTSQLVKDLEQNVNIQFKNQQGQIDNVKKLLQDLYQQENDNEKRASQLLSLAKDTAERIQNETLHNKYAPGKLGQIIRSLNTTISSSDGSQAKQAEARNEITKLLDLEDEITKEKFIFETIHNKVLTEASALLKEMAENRKTYPTDENGNRYKDENNNDVSLEVDFWTNGKYSVLEQEVKKLDQELINNKDNVELDKNRLQIISDRISQIKQEQSELVVEALKKGLASEHRAAISDEIINAMLNQGWELKLDNDRNDCHNYLGGDIPEDQREGVFATLVNGDSEVTFVINTNEDNCTQVIFQRNDEIQRTDGDFRASLNEIKTILERNAGINMGNFNTPIGTGDHKQVELADPIALAKAGISKETKRRLGLSK